MRLDKFLGEMGFGTRKEIKGMVKMGRVRVNQAVAAAPDLKIDPDKDCVLFDGKEVAYAAYEYYMLNKPAGYVSATEDPREKTVLDLIPGRLRDDLFPVGRLDKDTEGLLLITNDGVLAHRLLSPKRHVDKTYYAVVQGQVTEKEIECFARGLDIGDQCPTLPARLELIGLGGGASVPLGEGEGKRTVGSGQNGGRETSSVKITIHEGRYHQIKRMFQAIDMEVLYLKRLSMGSLHLDGQLEAGGYRKLTEEELKALKEV